MWMECDTYPDTGIRNNLPAERSLNDGRVFKEKLWHFSRYSNAVTLNKLRLM